MSNKKRSTKRQVRVPVKFNDHVVGNLSQKRNDDCAEELNEQIRVLDEDPNIKGGNDKNDLTNVIDEPNRGIVNENMVSNGVKSVVDKNDVVKEVVGTDGTNDVDVKDKLGTDSNGNKVQGNSNGVQGETIVRPMRMLLRVWMNLNKLNFMPTGLNELGNEVVVFDEELVEIGSKKWQLTLCGYFMGHRLSFPEVRYHLKRMWGRYGLQEIMDNANGYWLFKFGYEEDIGMEKTELDKIPLWVKFTNVPMEAWSVERLNAVAISVRKPIIMDNITAKVCKIGTGRTEYARILIEISDVKGFKKQWTKKKPNVESMGGNGKEKSFEEEFPKLPVKNTKERSTKSLHGNERMKNKYSVLIDVESDNMVEIKMLKDRMIVDDTWEADREKERLDQEAGIERMVEGIVEDVLEDDYLATQNLVCDRAFGGWEWVSNSKFSENGCRIVVGWDNNAVNLMVINMTRQDMLCLIENKYDKNRVCCSFVYSANTGKERQVLWKELEMSKAIVQMNPWVILGDFNVTFKSEEHSDGTSVISHDMQEFIDCTNSLEIEDICSFGLLYTWIKSLLNPQSSVLKKLDRVMLNEGLVKNYDQAYAIFHPYVISDHSPIVLTIPKAMKRKPKAFRFLNFITEKPKFLDIIQEG
ncbi:RNA-directed DNA polymerase, eukaryota, reverse transcriptase zinc-binding domain protein [Tanacetum coccineum]